MAEANVLSEPEEIDAEETKTPEPEKAKPELKEVPKEITEEESRDQDEEDDGRPKKKDDPKVHLKKIQTALRQEREEKRRISQEAESLRARFAEVDKLKSELEEHRKSRQAQIEDDSFKQDPATYLKTRIEKTEAQLNEERRTREESQTRAIQEHEFIGAVQSQTHAFTQEQKDYPDAFNYIRDKRFQMYEALGMEPSEFEAAFNKESIGMSLAAMQRSQNPAKVLYTIAQTMGYTPKAQESNAETTIERMEKGAKAAKTLKGAAAESSFLKQVEEMSDDEFDKFWDTQIKPKKGR